MSQPSPGLFLGQSSDSGIETPAAEEAIPAEPFATS